MVETSDRSSRPTVPRVVASFLAGLVAVGVVAVVTIAAERLVLTAVVPPAVGGAVAGFLARGRRRFGTGLGMALGLTLAVGASALFVVWIESRPPMTGGEGLAIAALFLIVVVVGFLAILFGGLGGLLGAALRRELERSPRSTTTDKPDEAADAARSDDRVPTATAGSRPIAERSTAARADRADEEPVAESAADRRSTTNVLIGSALSTVVFYVPGSPFVGGVAVGYLERGGWRRGALLGAASGLVASALAATVLALLAVAVFFVVATVLVDLLPWLAAVLLGYFVVLSTVGGAVGGVLSSADFESRPTE